MALVTVKSSTEEIFIKLFKNLFCLLIYLREYLIIYIVQLGRYQVH